eukprot:GFUD01023075.1.p1 GENE.GFUD01023075.1~~GFUD01023075.1.p1  ORF type:complete len:482 (+),score=140.48 GFUD01023075.1:166-1611(+)
MKSLKRKSLNIESTSTKKKIKKTKHAEQTWALQTDKNKTIKTKNEVKTEYIEMKTENTIKPENIKSITEIEIEGCEIKKEYSGISMKTVSPGRALILDLLVKSVEKINAAESSENSCKVSTHSKKLPNDKNCRYLKRETNENEKSKHDYNELKGDDCPSWKKDQTNFIKTKFEVKKEILEDTEIEGEDRKIKPEEDTKKCKDVARNTNEKDAMENIIDVSNQTVDNNKKSNKVRKARKSGKDLNKFTPEEDKSILYEMDTCGDQINIVKLAKELNRNHETISDRIKKLKTGKTWRENRAYTLTDDLVIIDAVLKELKGNSLEKLDLPSYREWKTIGDQIGRQERHVKFRWEYYLKTWLLQHFSGTLNLDIRRMLANYLADNFEDVDSVNWLSVASRTEFAGQTQTSLRYQYVKLFNRTKIKMNGSGEEVTLKHIADITNKQFKEGRFKKISEKTLTRQKKIIDYFEKYVGDNRLTFTLYSE